MSVNTAKRRPKVYCGKNKRFQRVGLRMCVDARTDGNFLFIFDHSPQENKKWFSHFRGNVSKKGRIVPPSRCLMVTFYVPRYILGVNLNFKEGE